MKFPADRCVAVSLFVLRLLPLLSLIPARASALPVVAVMPFKDLTSGKASIGEAIRETVTSDLKEVGGLKVIERAFIDKVLSEQNLQSQRTDLDPTSTVRVGKLLGAQLIVAGAYQEAKPKVRLTARFINVETGQIVGTAKVDGATAEFLKLQDAVTVELLKSAGLEAARVQHVARRPRPRLRNLRTVELYGESLLVPDEAKKKQLLRQALDQDPEFAYASRDLDALEKRLRQYDAVAQAEQNKATSEMLATLKAEKDPAKQAQALQNLINTLQMQRRYRQVAALGRYVLQSTPPPAPTGYPSFAEQAQFLLVTAATMYNDWDGVLREGEVFCARHPASMYFTSVRSYMDKAITEKRFIEEGAGEAAAEIGKLTPAERADPCRVAGVWLQHRQWKDLAKTLRGMTQASCYNTLPVSYYWFQVAMATGDFKLARDALARMKESGSSLYNSYRSMEMGFPME